MQLLGSVGTHGATAWLLWYMVHVKWLQPENFKMGHQLPGATFSGAPKIPSWYLKQLVVPHPLEPHHECSTGLGVLQGYYNVTMW